MKTIAHLCCALTLVMAGTADAGVIMDFVGDADELGGQVIGGTMVNDFSAFDNRSAAELAATDGAQFTDHGTSINGISEDFVDFIHTFAATTETITSVTVEFGLGGVQSNDNNPMTKGSLEDGLFVDGILIDDAFEPLEQGQDGFGVFSVTLPSTVFGLFADGMAVIRIDSNSFGGTVIGTTGTDPIWYDYSKITIETQGNPVIPEPASMALFSTGLIGLAGAYRRRQKLS